MTIKEMIAELERWAEVYGDNTEVFIERFARSGQDMTVESGSFLAGDPPFIVIRA